MTRPYYVSYENCTDGEPRPGWYVAGEDGERPIGPFNSQEDAEALADDDEYRPRRARLPALGDWLAPLDGSAPGMVVNVLPSGEQCVLARGSPPTYEVRETVHDSASLKGPMTGRPIKAGEDLEER